MDYSLPGSSIHGISQARILQWVAVSFSMGFSWPSHQTHVSCLTEGFFTTKPPGKHLSLSSMHLFMVSPCFFPGLIACFTLALSNSPLSGYSTVYQLTYWKIFDCLQVLARLDESQTGIKIAGRNINNLRYADYTTLMAESKEELKSFLMRVKKESEKTGLKLSVQKAKIMASSPITSWQIEGEKLETVTDFNFLGSKITVDSDCSYEIKTLAPWKKSYDKPRQRIKKQRHHFADKGPYIQGYELSSSHVRVWELDHKESWAPRIDAFELWCGRRLLRVLWTATRSNQSILKEINPEYSLEGLMLKQKLWYFGHLIWRTDSLEKTLMLGETEGKQRRRRRRMTWLDNITDTMNMSLSNLWEIVKDREAWCATVHGATKSRTWLSN